MSRRRAAKPENLENVFENIVESMGANNASWGKRFCRDFNQMLDDQVEDEFFGEDGEEDPRKERD